VISTLNVKCRTSKFNLNIPVSSQKPQVVRVVDLPKGKVEAKQAAGIAILSRMA
jgi:ribosomal 30S subunit maturation factor RimM